MSDQKNETKKKGINIYVVAAIVAVLIFIGYQLHWDYGKARHWPVVKMIAGWFDSTPDLAGVKTSLMEKKMKLATQKAAQSENLQKSSQTFAALGALRNSLAKSIVASEKDGSQIDFSGRVLTPGEAKKQLEMVLNAHRIAKDDLDFRNNVIVKIDETATEVAESLCLVERAASVKDAAEILNDMNLHSAEIDAVIEQAMRPFTGPAAKTGLLTEDALLEYASKQQPPAKNKVDVDTVLNEFRSQNPDTPVATQAPTATPAHETPSPTKAIVEVDDDTVVVLRVKNGAADANHVK